MAPSITSEQNSFSSAEKTIYLFFECYPVENKLDQIFFKKAVMYELCGLFI